MIIIYLAIAGACAEKEANSGGGGSASISLATSSSGNYNNALIVGLYAGGQYDALFENGGNSTFSTGTTPTRTIQDVDVTIENLINLNDGDGTTMFFVVIGGYVRHTGSSISSIHWQTGSGAQSSSLSNGVSIISLEVEDNREHTQDNTALDGSFPEGIYHSQTASSGSGFYMHAIQLGSGPAFPDAGDSVTFRTTVSASVDGTSVSAIHDIVLNFVE